MRNNVIFEITKDHLEVGLRNLPVGYSPTSLIDGTKGLFYVGRSCLEVSNWAPLKVIYLLIYGREPSETELSLFEENIMARSALSQNLLSSLLNSCRELDPLQLFSYVLHLLGLFEKREHIEEALLDLIAKIPILCSHIINFHANLEISKCEGGFLKNFVSGLNLQIPNRDLFYETLILIFILYLDQGGGSNETFAARVAFSAQVDIYSALSISINSLMSNLTGKASLHSYRFLKKIQEKYAIGSLEQIIENAVLHHISENKILYGFGHTIFKMEDPRAAIMFDFAKKRFAEHPLVSIAFYLRVIGKKLLIQKTKITNPNMNLDGILGPILEASGFKYEIYFPLLIALSRSIGVAIQLFHESKKKKKKMIEPHYIYRAIL